MSKEFHVSDFPQIQPTPSQPVQSGLSENAAGALAYVTIIPAIIFLIVEPYNRNPFVKFHAWQNIFLCIGMFALGIIGVIPILGQIIFLLGFLAAFVLWLTAIIKASQGGKFHIPIIGNIAEKQANS
jgi:uncharacterized membrane protein